MDAHHISPHLPFMYSSCEVKHNIEISVRIPLAFLIESASNKTFIMVIGQHPLSKHILKFFWHAMTED